MSRKGVSAEEKKMRMLQLFHEKGEFFQLKELEKIAPKEKGIIANSVKDVIQKLVDDGLIETDKIGSSIYFWSFPSKTINTKKRKLEEIEEKLNVSNKKLKIAEKTIDESKISEEDEEKRDKLLTEISKLETELEAAKVKLKQFKENNPELLKDMINKQQVIKDAANRWTDNIFAVKSWCRNKFFVEDNVLSKQFGIPEDLDYLE